MVKPRSVFPVVFAGAITSLYLPSFSQNPIAPFLFIQKEIKWDAGVRDRRYCARVGLCEDMKLSPPCRNDLQSALDGSKIAPTVSAQCARFELGKPM